jgi:hypothetical protein
MSEAIPVEAIHTKERLISKELADRHDSKLVGWLVNASLGFTTLQRNFFGHDEMDIDTPGTIRYCADMSAVSGQLDGAPQSVIALLGDEELCLKIIKADQELAIQYPRIRRI